MDLSIELLPMHGRIELVTKVPLTVKLKGSPQTGKKIYEIQF